MALIETKAKKKWKLGKSIFYNVPYLAKNLFTNIKKQKKHEEKITGLISFEVLTSSY